MTAAEIPVTSGSSFLADVRVALARHRVARFSGIILLLMAALALLGPLFSPFAFDQTDLQLGMTAPDLENRHYFGTDRLGRDMFVRTLYGGRISLLAGVVATFVSLLIGVTYGAVAGYLGGRRDAAMMRIVDILYALPFMFLVILLTIVFGRHIILIFIAIGAINWLDMARIVRGQTLSLRNRGFVEAAKLAGAGTPYIIVRHIVPNLLGVVVVYVTLTVPQVILVESFLSFLGLGVQEPMTSWGALISDGIKLLEVGPWLLWYPAAFLVLTLMCLNFLGDGLRDAFDPQCRGDESA